MQDFCPLCMKNGVKKKIKLLQINLQEAVWACEEEKCVWPFGYEDFRFFPRAVGKIWSCYWDNHKPAAPRIKESISASMEKPLRPPAVTSLKDTLENRVSNSDFAVNHSKSISTSDTTSMMIQETNHLNGPSSTYKKENVTLRDNNHWQHSTENCSNVQVVDSSHLDINFKSLHDNIKNEKNVFEDNCTESKFSNSIVAEPNFRSSSNNQTDLSAKEEKKFYAQNAQNVNNVRGVPKITSIEKTNIDISNVIIGNQISLRKELGKKVVNVNDFESNTITKSSFNNFLESQTLVDSEPSENIRHNNKMTIPKSNVNITMMEIEGLPPITLSYQIPTYSAASESVISNVRQCNTKDDTITDLSHKSMRVVSPRTKNRLSVRRNVTSGKQYEKFSFSAIKKKMELNNNDEAVNHSADSLKVKQDLKEENSTNDLINVTKNENSNDKDNQQAGGSDNDNCDHKNFLDNTSTNHTSNLINECGTMNSLSNQTNILSLDTPVANTNASIGNVLEDFLTNDYNVPQDINDDWIHSLLMS